jgi:hypothetical protein
MYYLDESSKHNVEQNKQSLETMQSKDISIKFKNM